METTNQKINITSDEFFSGVIAGLSYNGIEKFRINDTLHKTMVEVTQEQVELDLLFLLKLNPYGRSHGVSVGLANAHMRGLIYYRTPFDNNAYIGIRYERAEAILDGLPGGRKVYLDIVDKLLDKFITVY